MSPKEQYPRDRSNALEQHYTLLAYYFMYLKAYRALVDDLPKCHVLHDSGSLPSLLPKEHLYKLAGKKVFYKPGTASKYIRKMLDDNDAVREAMIMIDEGLV